jgi:hypothetical protein
MNETEPASDYVSSIHADVERCHHSEFDQDTRQVLRCVCRSGHLDRHLLSPHRLTP